MTARKNHMLRIAVCKRIRWFFAFIKCFGFMGLRAVMPAPTIKLKAFPLSEMFVFFCHSFIKHLAKLKYLSCPKILSLLIEIYFYLCYNIIYFI